MTDSAAASGEIDPAFLAGYAPNPGRHALLPPLTPHQELALLCRVLHREGYADHIAGHITIRQDDGTYLANPWELTWAEIKAGDVLRLDRQGKVIEGLWNITPAINLHLEVHEYRHDIRVVIHNHPEWGSVWAGAHRVPPAYDQTSAMVDTEPALYNEYLGTVEDGAAGTAAARALGGNKWAILANHGVFVVGGSIRQAHLRALTLEWRCRLAWRVEVLGGGKALPPETVKAVGARIDANGFPFLWEAMARAEIARDARVLD